MGRATFFEAAYVGNFGRHLLWEYNFSPIPIGAQFLTLHPENRDPTTNAAFANNFLRPYAGYGDILEYEFGVTSNYNSVQSSFSTRLRAGFQMRVAYTFSQGAGQLQQRHLDHHAVFPARVELRAAQFQPRPDPDDVPQLERAALDTAAESRAADRDGRLDRLCHGAVLRTGRDSRQWTARTSPGTPSQGAQMLWVGPAACADAANCPLAQQFARPGFPRASGANEQVYWGNLGVNMFNRPGINNWDMRLTRRFRLFHERTLMDFRLEAFNVFNHAQFSGLDTTARFDATRASRSTRCS